MTSYDREFLVPYLENICALHLLEKKLSSQYDKAIQKKNENAALLDGGVKMPEYPREEKVGTFGRVLSLVFGLFVEFWLFLGFLTIPAISSYGIVWFLGISAIFFIVIPIIKMIDSDRCNKVRLRTYESKKASVQRQRNRNKEIAQQQLPIIEEKINKLVEEYNNVSKLLKDAYNANIIPRHYRDIYTAVYLYDWFSTSSSTDMDHALSMFALEEIRERLDIIISNQSEEIMNQRIMIAKQNNAIEDQKIRTERLMNKLNQIQTTEEERNKYLSMIESNTAANAYFAAANYLQNY